MHLEALELSIVKRLNAGSCQVRIVARRGGRINQSRTSTPQPHLLLAHTTDDIRTSKPLDINLSSTKMNTLLLLIVALLSFIVLLLAWFAISSCLGDEIRAHLSGRSIRTIPTTFGLQYARTMGHGGNQAGWEQIEMVDMLDKNHDYRE